MDNHTDETADSNPLGIDDLELLFELYTRKVAELEAIEISLAMTQQLKSSIGHVLSDAAMAKLEASAANDNHKQTIATQVRILEYKIVEQLARRPDDVHRLTPRQFEELVCALLADMGLDVQLTPQTRDGGRDILAVAHTPLGEFLTIVECKKYRAENPVSIKEIRSFLFTIREYDRASCGLLASTSYFSKDASNLAADYMYQLKLKDAEDITGWLRQYGNWTNAGNSGFWLPNPEILNK